MAIDYNSGISSLDAGASDITYSGNEGPKSPQQQQQQQQMMIAQLKQEYEQYKMEQIEIDPSQILSFEEWYQSVYEASRQGVADGGRTGFQGGGSDYMPLPEGPMGNPAVVEEIENAREFRIANPNIEDVADYEGYYERLKRKRLQEMMRRRSEDMTPLSGPVYSEQDYPQFFGDINPGFPRPTRAYGGTAHPTYTQSRKQNLAYGGIAGLDGRRQYGLGSWVQKAKDKFVDDIIPNEIKENPMLTAAVLGGAANQWDLIPGQMSSQNWLGELLGKVPGTGGTMDTVFGQGGSEYQTIGQGIKNIFTGGANLPPQLGGPSTKQNAIDIAKQVALNKLGVNNQPQQSGGILDTLFGNTQMGNETVNWKKPLAAGLSIGALDAATRKKDMMPQDTSGIDIPAIRAAALQGQGGAFLPPASATTAYAQGGRTGYYAGDSVGQEENIIEAFSIYKNSGGKEDFRDWYSNTYLPESAQPRGIASSDPSFTPTPSGEPMDIEDWRIGEPMDIEGWRGMAAQGGRIGAQEGGLMNLGGMEKDYRQEGGFVPLGGEEKADDVPARLSKNEFVFTADAVRAAGGGDIDAGAEVMENLMNNLEQGGQVSEDSQGLEGARDMFATSQRLEGVM